MLAVEVSGSPKDTFIACSFRIDGCPDSTVIISDPPHLCKNTRNALFSQKQFVMHKEFQEEFKLESPLICLSAIWDIIEYQEKKELMFAPHIKREHLELKGNFMKMKVSPAKSVLSRETADAIMYLDKYVCHKPYYPSTAKFCEEYGEFYDFATSRTSKFCFRENNLEARIAFLEHFKCFFGSLKVNQKQDDGFWPIQRGTLLTCTSLIELGKKLIKEEKLKFLLGGRFTTDSVENIHSCIREHNSNPTPVQYKRILKTISLTQVMRPLGKNGNYEMDCPAEFITQFKDVKKFTAKLENEDSKELMQDELNFDMEKFVPSDDFYDQNTVAYLSGYVLGHTIKTNSKCLICIEAFILPKKDNDNQMANTLIVMKEFKAGCLVKPTEQANSMFQIAEAIFKEKRGELVGDGMILDKLRDLAVDKVSNHFGQDFPKCHLKVILRRYIKLRLIFWTRLHSARLETDQSQVINNASYASKSSRAHLLFSKGLKKPSKRKSSEDFAQVPEVKKAKVGPITKRNTD